MLVGPGELPVKEQDFHKAEVVYEIIKKRSLGRVKVVIGLTPRCSDEIEIPHDRDRSRDCSKKCFWA
jgi:hypothetical protein